MSAPDRDDLVRLLEIADRRLESAESDVERLRSVVDWQGKTLGRVKALPNLWFAETSDGAGHTLDHWRGPDYVDGRDLGVENCIDELRAALDGAP